MYLPTSHCMHAPADGVMGCPAASKPLSITSAKPTGQAVLKLDARCTWCTATSISRPVMASLPDIDTNGCRKRPVRPSSKDTLLNVGFTAIEKTATPF